ncbi:MAG TPA: hypothetical protein VK524_14760 [Polyangiaceae bacterium]|nr:hypothetical protein [Polyangiaceae bacterium]
MTLPAAFTRWTHSHRGEWRLTGHFFNTMFDFGILTPAGADSFTHMLLGAVGVVIAIGLALTRIYAGKYAALSGAPSPEPYRQALLGDDLFLIGLPMLLVALLTLLISHSVFPDERDFRILGPLPVRRAVIFGAKLVALLLFTGIFIALLHVSLLPLMLLTSINRFSEHAVFSRLAAWALASVAASVFAVLAVTASVGLLMLALSRHRLHALTALTRSLMLGVLVLCVPFVFHLPGLGASLASGSWLLVLVPPSWFVGLERTLLGSADPWFVQLTGVALAAFGGAAAIVAAVYVQLFRHFERLLLRPLAIAPSWSRRDRPIAAMPAAPDGLAQAGQLPAFRAVYRFMTATLGRSQLHQGVLLGLSACGVGLVMNRLVGAGIIGRVGSGEPPSPSLVSVAMWTPFALMFVCGVGVRAALALPMEHRANWIFRLTEDIKTRCEQMRAVNRVVALYVIGVPVAAAAPLLWTTMGSTAVIAATIVTLVGFVFVHVVLLDWRRIPFTCSYLPGKRLVAHTLVFGFAAFVVFTTAGVVLIRVATVNGTQALLIAATLSLAAWLLRRRRLSAWRETPLMFEDELPDQPLQLGL